MPEMHLRHLMHLRYFTYSACGPFTKNNDGRQKFKETGYSRYIYQKELDKVCFQHDMVDGEQPLIKHYVIKHLVLLKLKNMMDINVDLPQWSIDFSIKSFW